MKTVIAHKNVQVGEVEYVRRNTCAPSSNVD